MLQIMELFGNIKFSRHLSLKKTENTCRLTLSNVYGGTYEKNIFVYCDYFSRNCMYVM